MGRGLVPRTVGLSAVACLLLLLLGPGIAPAFGADGVSPQGELTADLVIYGSTTSGIGAAWAVEQAEADLGVDLDVVLVKPTGGLESALANGLSIEDVYGGEAAVNGFAQVIRDEIVRRYQLQGIYPLVGGRLMYEPSMAQAVLSWFYDRNGAGRPGFTELTGRLLAADDGSVTVDDAEGPTRVRARYFIDASTEGDLVQLLGAQFMVGTTNKVYSAQNPPPVPSPDNGWATAPQFFSALLTMSLEEGAATPIRTQSVPFYDPDSYGPDADLGANVLEGFWTSWSMTHILPGDKRELNESWSDYPSLETSYDWVFKPELREELRREFVSHAVNHLRWLQEAGYPQVGLEEVPQYPYVREGIRAVGRRIYLGRDIELGLQDKPVAYGVYARYDRHDGLPRFTTQYQDSVSAAVWVPMMALQLLDHPNHLVSTAVSTDESAYNSSIRMEWTRANMGGAAGVMAVVADSLGLDVAKVPYEAVREELLNLGWRFGPRQVVSSFSDVPGTSEYYAPVHYLASLGIVNGYADGSFGLYGTVKRAQLAKMMVLALGLHDEEVATPETPTFPDVPYGGASYPFDYVEEAARSGLVSGFLDGNFGPWRELTRIQLVRIIVRAGAEALETPPEDFELTFTDVPGDDREAVATAVYNGLVDGRSPEEFDPYGTAARGHVAKILYNYLTGGIDSAH